MVDRIPSRRVPGREVFARGNKAGAGRPKGVPNKTTRILKEAVLMAAEAVGHDGKGRDGLLGYLRGIAVKEPRSFVTLLAKILPLQIAGDAERPVVVTLGAELLKALTADKADAARVLRQVLQVIQAGGGTLPQKLPGPGNSPADPARYAETLRSGETIGRA